MSGKRARFEAQVLPHLDAAYRFARWLAPREADDLVQEAMLRAYRAVDSLRSADAKSWLLAIVRNCFLSSRQQEQRRAQVPLPADDDAEAAEALVASGDDPERATLASDGERTFDRLMTQLSEEHREVLMLREIEEMNYREIAGLTGVPIGTVMSRLARARAALKALWLQQVAGGALELR